MLTNYNRYDYNILDSICDEYIYFSDKYNKLCSTIAFSNWCNISTTTIDLWSNNKESSPASFKVWKNCKESARIASRIEHTTINPLSAPCSLEIMNLAWISRVLATKPHKREHWPPMNYHSWAAQMVRLLKHYRIITWLIMQSNCIYNRYNSNPLIYKALRAIELLQLFTKQLFSEELKA